MNKRARLKDVASTAATAHAAVRGKALEAIILSIVEAGRFPTQRVNFGSAGEATAAPSPTQLIPLPWTGTQPAVGTLPDGQTLIELFLDPLAMLWYYDYNVGGSAASYQWQFGFIEATRGYQNFVAIPAFIPRELTPMWAISLNTYSPHGGTLFSKRSKKNGKIYMLMQAGSTAPNANSTSTVTIAPASAASLVAGDRFILTWFQYLGGQDALVIETNTAVAANGVAPALPAFEPVLLGFYRVCVNFIPTTATSVVNPLVSVTQGWTIPTVCVLPAPEVQKNTQFINRIRTIGASVDVVNLSPEIYKGGSCVATQFPAGTDFLSGFLPGNDPTRWVGGAKNETLRKFADGTYTFVKPDAIEALGWKQPFQMNNDVPSDPQVAFSTSVLEAENGFVAIALNSPDIAVVGGNQATRGPVTMQLGASLEVDSDNEFYEYHNVSTTDEEWDLALDAVAAMDQWWDDPNWAKIWAAIKSAGKVAAQVLTAIPHPYAQIAGRGVSTFNDIAAQF